VAVDAPADMPASKTDTIGHVDLMLTSVHWLGFRMMLVQCVAALHVTVLAALPKNSRVGVEHVTPTAPHWQLQVALGTVKLALPE